MPSFLLQEGPRFTVDVYVGAIINRPETLEIIGIWRAVNDRPYIR